MTVRAEIAPAPVQSGSASPKRADPGELRLVASVRAGDEAAFAELTRRYGPTMLRLAQLTVGTRAGAEEVVQEAWIGVLNGIDRFEGRSSLKTWIFRILLNKANTRAARETRTIPFSAMAGRDFDVDEPSVDADRFLGADSEWAGHWASTPQRFEDLPEERLLAGETLDCVAAALAKLPWTQRAVVTMRDVAGWSSDDVCGALDLSASNQRVLLHRGRSKVRAALEAYLDQA
jgi:RNA polymerase sigma-70 factor (ECF subfamily)